MQRQISFVVLVLFIGISTIDFAPAAWSAILIDDTTIKSGITPVIGDGNAMKFKNELRRRAYALFYLIEATDGDGAEKTYSTDKPTESVRISSTQKLEGMIGTILQVIQGNTALTPAYSKNVVLELPDDCEDCQKAKYKVVVVGPGASYGDGIEGLNTEEQRLVEQLQRETFIFDILIPVILIELPDNVKEHLGSNVTSIYEDLLFCSKFTPLVDTVMTKLMEGDIKGAAQDFFNLFVTDSDLQEEVAKYLVKKLEGEIKEQAKAAIKSSLKSLDVTNIIMTVLDQVAIIRDITSEETHMADLWNVQVMPKTLHIKPRSSTVSYEQSITLTVEVKDGGQPYKSGNLKFLWVTENNLGTLTASDGSNGYEIYTADDSVEYTSESEAASGQDTVKVTVDEGGVEIGSVSARVYVNNSIVYNYGMCRANVSFSKWCQCESGGWCSTVDCVECGGSSDNRKCIGECREDERVYVYVPSVSCDSRPCVCYSYYVNPDNGFCGWIPAHKCVDDRGFYYIELFWTFNLEEKSIRDILKENCNRMHFMSMINTDNSWDGWECPCEDLCPFYESQSGFE